MPIPFDAFGIISLDYVDGIGLLRKLDRQLTQAPTSGVGSTELVEFAQRTKDEALDPKPIEALFETSRLTLFEERENGASCPLPSQYAATAASNALLPPHRRNAIRPEKRPLIALWFFSSLTLFGWQRIEFKCECREAL